MSAEGLIKVVNEATFDSGLTDEDLREGLRSVIELLADPTTYSDPPVHYTERQSVVWGNGYRQAVVDILEALADEWGLDLNEEDTDEGERER